MMKRTIINLTLGILFALAILVVPVMADSEEIETMSEDIKIESLVDIPGIEVEFGTAFEDIELPPTVLASLSDGSTETVEIDWSAAEASYDGKTAGTYTLEGGLVNLPDGVDNPDTIQAEVTVIVDEEPSEVVAIESLEAIPGIEVEFGTAFEDIELPPTVLASLSDGSTETVEIDWSAAEASYDGKTAGTYTLEGGLVNLPDGVDNPDTIRAEVTVSVSEKPFEMEYITVSSTSPADGASGVRVGREITVTFNTDLDDAAWDLSFTNDADEYVASHETSDGAVLTITPDDYLEYNTEYTITIYPPPEDSKATHGLKDAYTFSFTTEDDAVSVKNTLPADGETEVPVSTIIEIAFTRNIQSGAGGLMSIDFQDEDSRVIGYSTGITGSVLTIIPNADLAYDTEYTIRIPVDAVAGTTADILEMKQPYSFTFHTKPSADGTATKTPTPTPTPEPTPDDTSSVESGDEDDIKVADVEDRRSIIGMIIDFFKSLFGGSGVSISVEDRGDTGVITWDGGSKLSSIEKAAYIIDGGAMTTFLTEAPQQGSTSYISDDGTDGGNLESITGKRLLIVVTFEDGTEDILFDKQF